MIEWIRKVIDSIIEDDNFCGFLGSGLKQNLKDVLQGQYSLI